MNYAQLYVSIQSYVQNYETDFVSSIPTFVRQAERRIYNSVQLAYLRRNLRGTLTPGNQYLSVPADFLSTYSIAVIDGDGNYEYLLDKDVNFIRSSYPNPLVSGLPKYYALFGPTTSAGAITNDLSFILGPTPSSAYGVEIHYYFYPASIVSGIITGLESLTPGSGYVDDVYYNVALTGGAGASATATIIVTDGIVTSCVLENPGSLYLVGDVLSASQEVIGGGVGFTTTVSTINNSTGTTWLGDSYDQVLLYACLVEAYGFMKGEGDMMAYYLQKYDEGIKQLKRLGDGLERGDAYRDGQFKMPVKS